MANDLHDKLVEHLAAMEECCAVCEVESKGWHDAWVVRCKDCKYCYAEGFVNEREKAEREKAERWRLSEKELAIVRAFPIRDEEEITLF